MWKPTILDYPMFCELKAVFRLKIERKLAKCLGVFEILFPLKGYFSEILKIVPVSSQIAHTIGNFFPKNFKTVI